MSPRPLLLTVPQQASSPEQPAPSEPAQRIAQLTPLLVDLLIESARQRHAYLVGYGGIQAHAAF